MTDRLHRADAPTLAIRHIAATGDRPTVLFLPGYASDMMGGKATALWDWAERTGHGCALFDWRGCGESEGEFADATLTDWLADATDVLDSFDGPVVLVGSSMGGWVALLLALARPERVAGLVGIAAAPDFTDWGFSGAERARLAAGGDLKEPSAYDDSVMLTTGRFWRSGEQHLLLNASIPLPCLVRLLHGTADAEVPAEVALRLLDRIESPDATLTLVDGGDHRLSGERDLARLVTVVEDVARSSSANVLERSGAV